jgi:hypothetical protein
MIRYELLLLALSSFILRRQLPAAFPDSRGLVLRDDPDIELTRAHCLIHSYQLSKDTRRRNQIRKETNSFSTLLQNKDKELSNRERNLNPNLDADVIFQQCINEKARWEKNWNTVRGEWILTSLKSTSNGLSFPIIQRSIL